MENEEKVEPTNETPAEENVHVDSDMQNPIVDEKDINNDSTEGEKEESMGENEGNESVSEDRVHRGR